MKPDRCDSESIDPDGVVWEEWDLEHPILVDGVYRYARRPEKQAEWKARHEAFLDRLQSDRRFLEETLRERDRVNFMLFLSPDMRMSDIQRRLLLVEEKLARTKRGGRKPGSTRARNDDLLLRYEGYRAKERSAKARSDEQLIRRIQQDLWQESGGKKVPSMRTLRAGISDARRRRDQKS
jgi:hypothetical protein